MLLKTIALTCFALVSTVSAADNMKAFPPAEAGMTRHLLQVPTEKDEDSFKLELIVGKTVKLDAENRYFFGGQIEAVNIEGWGFTRYVVGKLGPMAGTLMAPDPSAPKVDRFISLAGEPYLIRYNSRLPVVVYVPEGVELRYRIWRADPDGKAVPQG
jgi:ecotin